jgi:RHS repeat-associated protein
MQDQISPNVGKFIILGFVAAGVVSMGQTPAVTFSPTAYEIPATYKPGEPVGSYVVSPIESINLYNGHLNLTVPLRTISGRGEAGYTISIPITRPTWQVQINEGSCGANCFQYYAAPDPDWTDPYEPKYTPGLLLLKNEGELLEDCDPTGGVNLHYRRTFTYLIFRQPDGTETALYGVPADPYAQNGVVDASCTANPPPNRARGTVFRSRDAAPLVFTSETPIVDNDDPQGYNQPPFDAVLYPSGTLAFPNGLKYQFIFGRVARITDRNGNKVTFCYEPVIGVTPPVPNCYEPGPTNAVHPNRVIDSLGRQTAFLYDVANPPGLIGTFDGMQFNGANGAVRNVWIGRIPYQSRLRSGITFTDPFPDLGGAGTTNFPVVSEIVLPDNRRYEFYYNNFGEVARMRLPTGGVVDYEHGAGLLNPDNYEGIYASGQILDEDIRQYSSPTPDFIKPFVYRRLLSRSAHSQDPAGTTYLVRQASYSRPERVTNVTRTNISGSSITTAYQSTSDLYVEVSDSNLRRMRHYFFSRYAGSINYLGAAAALSNGLDTRFNRVNGHPEIYEAKEYRTETLSQAGSVLLRTENAWTATQQSSPYVCQSNSTLYEGVNSLTSATITLRDLYFNVIDQYEYNYGSAPSLPAQMTTCSPTGTYLKRVQTAFHSESGYIDAGLVSLPVRLSIYGSNGVERARTDFAYDGSQLTQRSFAEDHLGAHPVSVTHRGNLTSQSRYLNISTSVLSTETSEYDVAGNVVTKVDPMENETQIGYSSTYSFAFPVTITNALSQTISASYDLNLGLPATITDRNSIVTSFSYNDSLDRLTGVVRGATSKSYAYPFDSVSRTTTIRTTSSLDAGRSTVDETVIDGLGRVVQSRRSMDGSSCATDLSNCIVTRHIPDALDRIGTVFNPVERSLPTACGTATPCTRTIYDDLGRVYQVIAADGSVTEIRYSLITTGTRAFRTTVVDPAAVSRTVDRDALGRLISAADGAGTASYQYDPLDNLETVTHGTQTRSFTYDAASRLTQATNPENGTIQYRYDANDNVERLFDARTTEANPALRFEYDDLNRLTRKWSPAGLMTEVLYDYDLDLRATGDSQPNYPVGHLVRVNVGAATVETNRYTYHRFNANGQIVDASQQIQTTNYRFAYTYNFQDQLTSMVYPAPGNRQIAYSRNALGQISGVNDATVTLTLASGISYWPHGAARQLTLGNGVVENWTYNSRLQPTQLLVMQAGVSRLLQLDNRYCPTIAACTTNNGSLRAQVIFAPLTQPVSPTATDLNVTQAFTYDAADRLLSVSETVTGEATPRWSVTHGYDQWGNRWIAGSTNMGFHFSTPMASDYYSTATNRLARTQSGVAFPTDAYDSVGNLQNHPHIGTMTYDAENRLTSFNNGSGPITFVYDGHGRRVQVTSPAGTTRFVYDVFGNLALEDSSQPATSAEREYVTADHLGSTRLVTDANGGVVRRFDYLPFGETIPVSSNTAFAQRLNIPGYNETLNWRHMFTGKERDAETGLDYFGARYFSGAQGRFTSVDPLLESADPSNPQSWNRYTYALNNPLRYVDRDGQIPVETVVDVASLGMSLRDLVRNPSWAAAGYALWDAGALALPYVPGSWVARVAKYGHRGLEAAGVLKRLDDFEAVVNNSYIREGVALLGQGDDSVRQVLGMGGRAADFLGVTSGGRFVLGEAKGVNVIAKGVEQLTATAGALMSKVPGAKLGSVEILVRKGDLDKLGKGVGQYRVQGSHLQQYNLKKKKWEQVRVEGEQVTVRELE